MVAFSAVHLDGPRFSVVDHANDVSLVTLSCLKIVCLCLCTCVCACAH